MKQLRKLKLILTVSLLCLLAVPAISTLAGEVINVNTASSSQLDKLYRVNPRIAGRIIAERQKNGPYRSLEDLETRIKEIGPKTIARWEGQVSVTQPCNPAGCEY